jgi:hypothetical protein
MYTGRDVKERSFSLKNAVKRYIMPGRISIATGCFLPLFSGKNSQARGVATVLLPNEAFLYPGIPVPGAAGINNTIRHYLRYSAAMGVTA